MENKLYVSNLPFSLDDQSLEQIFVAIGNVISTRIVTDRFSCRSKGYGFVEMSTKEEAEMAIQKLNGFVVQGRPIGVFKARAREEAAERRDRPQQRSSGPRKFDQNRPRSGGPRY